MEIAELKGFLKYAGFFLLSLLEKKLQRFSIFKNNPGRIDPPLPIFLGPRFLGHPIPDFGRVFCIRTGLNSCSLAKKAGSEIAGFSEKIRKILGGGSVRPPPLVNGGLNTFLSQQPGFTLFISTTRKRRILFFKKGKFLFYELLY